MRILPKIEKNVKATTNGENLTLFCFVKKKKAIPGGICLLDLTLKYEENLDGLKRT